METLYPSLMADAFSKRLFILEKNPVIIHNINFALNVRMTTCRSILWIDHVFEEISWSLKGFCCL